MDIIIINATPAMADVIGGKIARPRDRRERESPFHWFRQTCAFRFISQYGEIVDETLTGETAVDLRSAMGEPDAPIIGLQFAWVCPNSDGTRVAVLERRGRLLRDLRRRSGMTQAAFAAEIGIEANSLARLERGERNPSEPVMRMARIVAERETAKRS